MEWYNWFVKGNRPISNNLSFSQYGTFWRIEQKSLCKIICLPDIIKNEFKEERKEEKIFSEKFIIVREIFNMEIEHE